MKKKESLSNIPNCVTLCEDIREKVSSYKVVIVSTFPA